MMSTTDFTRARCINQGGQAVPLILLTPDASSLSARATLSFPDSDSAANHVAFWFPPESRATLSAFWALPVPPIFGDHEAIVLISHPHIPGLVYPFSFASMEEALEAVRAEVGRGLWIGRVAIYYAVPVTFQQSTDGTLSAEPVTPPPFRRPIFAPSRFSAIIAPPPVEESLWSRAFNAMRLRWWLPKAAPFAGFGSPPGRF